MLAPLIGNAELVLAILAAVLVAVSLVSVWVTAHPDEIWARLQATREQPWLVRLHRRYRHEIDLLIHRFRPQGAFGLSFTIGFVTLVASTWIFGGVLDDILGEKEIALLDEPIMKYLAHHRVPWLTLTMRGASQLGRVEFIGMLVVVAGILLFRHTRRWSPLALLAIAAGGGELLDLAIKLLVARPQPPVAWMVVPPTGAAFPSGLTAQSVTCLTLAYVLARMQPAWRIKVLIWTPAAMIGFLVGASGVYLGVHWPTDVLGGWAVSVAWLAILLTTTTTIGAMQSKAVATAGSTDPGLELPAAPTLRKDRPLSPPADTGLGDHEVRARIARGQINRTSLRASRRVREIVWTNVATTFNALLGGLLLVILLVGPLQDALFGLVLLANTLIGVIQELRAKRTLDRLSVITGLTTRVVREGRVYTMPIEKIVLDAVLELVSGDQIPVDGVVLSSRGLEIDESLLTGESAPMIKHVSDPVSSGSFVVSGSGRIQAVCVGEAAYGQQLAAQARHIPTKRSELRAGIDRLLVFVTWALVPIGALLVVSQTVFSGLGWSEAARASVAGIVGMVPEGLVLLTSVAMAAGVVRLNVGDRRRLWRCAC